MSFKHPLYLRATVQPVMIRLVNGICSLIQNENALFYENEWDMDGLDGHRSYWRDLRTKERIFSRRQGGGDGVIIWRAFSSKMQYSTLSGC